MDSPAPAIASFMTAMALSAVRGPLQKMRLPVPRPGPDQVLIRVRACGVCRTDLHIIDGELPAPALPRVPGHEIAGEVAGLGANVANFSIGERIGVGWLGFTCGQCRYCREGRENLCDSPLFTGYTIDGGYARYAVADHRYCFPLPSGYSFSRAAPLLCAGLIGYRSYSMIDPAAQCIGIYGFGAAAHIIAQIAVFRGKTVYAFVRPGDAAGMDFALRLGCAWAGPSDAAAPEELDAAIIFAPVGGLVPVALRAVRKGGLVVCGGIHMSAIPSFDYGLLWGERAVKSVANLQRKDGEEFMKLLAEIPVSTRVEVFKLEEADAVLGKLRRGEITGAAVLEID